MAETQKPKPEDRPVGKRVSALKALWPFMKAYRFSMIGAGLALIFTATVSLSLPIVAGQVVDTFGLASGEIGQHFKTMLASCSRSARRCATIL